MHYKILAVRRIILVIAMFSHPRIVPTAYENIYLCPGTERTIKRFFQANWFQLFRLPSTDQGEESAQMIGALLDLDRADLDLDPNLFRSASMAAASALRDFTDHWRQVNWLGRFLKMFIIDRGKCCERCSLLLAP